MMATDPEELASLMIKVMNSDITLQIFSYIRLYGPTTPSTMRNRLGMSKTSVFRSLDYLSSLKLVKKQVLSEAVDGSKQAYTLYQSVEQINRQILSQKSSLADDTRSYWEEALISFPTRLNDAFHVALDMFEPGPGVYKFGVIHQGIFDAATEPDKLKQVLQFIQSLTSNVAESEKGLVGDRMGQPISVTFRLSGYVAEIPLENAEETHIIHLDKNHRKGLHKSGKD